MSIAFSSLTPSQSALVNKYRTANLRIASGRRQENHTARRRATAAAFIPPSALPWEKSAERTAGSRSHHVANVVITSLDNERVGGISKGIGARVDGTTGAVVYHDELRREAAEWRVARRRVSPRRTPLRP
jgi:SnoaL-like protein